MTTNSEKNVIPPSVLWAQTKDKLYLTINVECEKYDVKIEKNSVSFKGQTQDLKYYEFDIITYADINVNNSKQVNKGRLIEIILKKEIEDDKFWPRLTYDNTKHHWLRVDFNRWQDEEKCDPQFSSDCSIEYDSCDDEDISNT